MRLHDGAQCAPARELGKLDKRGAPTPSRLSRGGGRRSHAVYFFSPVSRMRSSKRDSDGGGGVDGPQFLPRGASFRQMHILPPRFAKTI